MAIARKVVVAIARPDRVIRAARMAVVAALAAQLVLALPVPGADAEEGTGFVGGFEDLPLMAGLAEVVDARVIFDKPDGRIVEAFAVGDVDADAVRNFYAGALPQLGWRQVDAGSYQREGEVLRIEVEERDGGTAVRFAISPR